MSETTRGIHTKMAPNNGSCRLRHITWSKLCSYWCFLYSDPLPVFSLVCIVQLSKLVPLSVSNIGHRDLIMPQFSAFVDITDNSWKLYIMPQPSKSKRTEIKQIGPSNNPRKSLANWLQKITFSPRVIVNWENKQNLVSSEYSQRAKSCVGAPNLILVSEQRNTEKSIRPECYIGLYSLGLTENMVLYMTWNYWTISLDK